MNSVDVFSPMAEQLEYSISGINIAAAFLVIWFGALTVYFPVLSEIGRYARALAGTGPAASLQKAIRLPLLSVLGAGPLMALVPAPAGIPVAIVAGLAARPLMSAHIRATCGARAAGLFAPAVSPATLLLFVLSLAIASVPMLGLLLLGIWVSAAQSRHAAEREKREADARAELARRIELRRHLTPD